MSYLKEFPDFDFDPPYVEGFEDTSWHNNVSPSFARKVTDTHSITLWVDYLDPERRETGGKQFLVCTHETEDGDDNQTIIETDSFNEALEAIKTLIKEATE
jgi:hypothetical protein